MHLLSTARPAGQRTISPLPSNDDEPAGSNAIEVPGSFPSRPKRRKQANLTTTRRRDGGGIGTILTKICYPNQERREIRARHRIGIGRSSPKRHRTISFVDCSAYLPIRLVPIVRPRCEGYIIVALSRLFCPFHILFINLPSPLSFNKYS